MAICPFISGPMFDSSGTFTINEFTECVQSSCALWDSNNNMCSIKSNSLINQHIHSSHWHQRGHQCQDISLDCGGPFKLQSAPYAATLVNEFFANQDMDGNGKVYGYDFKIEDSATKPPMLNSVEINDAWTDPDISVSWDELLLWSNGDGPDPLT
jgi:hypothetical protein